MNSWNAFKERLMIKENNTCIVGPYLIHVGVDDTLRRSMWDRITYEVEKKHKITMTSPNRPVEELLFDFYRQVGRIALYQNQINRAQADLYYDHKKLTVMNRSVIVEDMTLDAFAMAQMEYAFKTPKVLPFMTMSKYKTLHTLESDVMLEKMMSHFNEDIQIRRDFIDYCYKLYKKKPDSKSIINKTKDNDMRADLKDFASEEGYGSGQKKSTPEKKIVSIVKKMSLLHWGPDFDSNLKHMIKIFTNDFDLVPNSDFVVYTDKYIVLYDEPEDWLKGAYYRKNPDGTYTRMKKIPDFEKGLYYRHEKLDERVLIKQIYDKYRPLFLKYIAPLYNKYNNVLSVNERYRYQFIIENILSTFNITGEMPTETDIDILNTKYEASISTSVRKAPSTMMTYNERKKILDTVVNSVAEKYCIIPYAIIDEYSLNNNMNKIVEEWDTSHNINKTIESMVLPYIRSGS